MSLPPISNHLRSNPQGLFRGVSAPLTAVSPSKLIVRSCCQIEIYRTHEPILSLSSFLLTQVYAVSFWGYDIGQRIVYSFKNEDFGRPLNLMEISIAGGISGMYFLGHSVFSYCSSAHLTIAHLRILKHCLPRVRKKRLVEYRRFTSFVSSVISLRSFSHSKK